MSSNEFPLGGVAPFGDPGDFDDLGGGGGGGGGRISNYTPQEYMRELALWLEFELGVGTTLREEALETGATFTPGAYLMLLIPLYEYKQIAGSLPTESPSSRESGRRARPLYVESYSKLVKQADEDPAAFDQDLTYKTKRGTPKKVVTSLSIIKSFWKKFCDIPPFCGETKGEP